MTWHADRDLLTGYTDGSLGRSSASSVEAHLTTCAACRATLGSMVDADRMERNLGAIIAMVDQPARRWPERLLVRCGVSDRLARLVAIVPGARDPWLGSVGVLLALATAWAVFGESARNTYVFMVAAPLLAVAAVAAVFAGREDAARELVTATPAAGLELLLVRWVAVALPAFAVTALVALAVPGIGWSAAAWMLPSVALATVTMALASWLPVRPVAAAVGAVWIAAAAISAHGTASARLIDRFVAFRPAGQVAMVGVAVAAAVVLVLRRERFEVGRTMGGMA